MTLAEVKARVLERLDETAAVSLRYTNALIEEYALEGARYYIVKTGCQIATTTITAVAYTTLYDLPCDCIRVNRVLWNSNGTYYPLEATHSRDLDNTIADWQRQTDTRSRSYFLLGLDRIALWPYSADGGEEYIVHYQQDVFNDLTAVPVEDHNSLIDYALGRFLARDGKPAESAEHLGRYKSAVEAAKRRMGNADRVWAR